MKHSVHIYTGCYIACADLLPQGAAFLFYSIFISYLGEQGIFYSVGRRCFSFPHCNIFASDITCTVIVAIFLRLRPVLFNVQAEKPDRHVMQKGLLFVVVSPKQNKS